MHYKFTKALAMVLTAAVITTSVTYTNAGAAKPKLNKKKITLTSGSSYTLKSTGIKAVKWSVNKASVVKLSAKKKKTVKLTAKKKGTAVVTAKYKTGKSSKKLTCKVTVSGIKKDNSIQTTANTPAVTTSTAVNTPTSASDTGSQITTQTSTPVPTNTPDPTPVPSPSVISANGKWAYIPFDDDTLLKEYEPIFGNVGTCLTYKGAFGKAEMQDAATMDFVRKNYNSYTLENEMKPSYMLADADADFRNPPFNKLISCEDAKAAGYVIPEGYTESTVPSINFDRIETILKVSAENGIRMRGHTLIWHSQTPANFFRVNYDKAGDFVSSDVMDQRIIFYVTNVMKHVLDSKYSSVVYAWDVVNEYFHQHSDGTDPNWSKIYNIDEKSGLSTKPTYVKLAFKTAYDLLKQYNLNDKVSLFYNDYNTSQVADNIVNMVNYINEKDDINTNGERICSGVGMQCHLDVKWPSVSEQLSTVKKFLDAGFEVQITELDIINQKDESEETLSDYWFDFMKGLVDFKMAGGNITGVTFWGLSDAVTWRFGTSALLYGKDINDPKKSLYAVYAAAQTSLNLNK